MNADLDFDDVQGLVRFAFGKMHRAYFYLVRVKDVGAARGWLLNAHVTTARELSQRTMSERSISSSPRRP